MIGAQAIGSGPLAAPPLPSPANARAAGGLPLFGQARAATRVTGTASGALPLGGWLALAVALGRRAALPAASANGVAAGPASRGIRLGRSRNTATPSRAP